MTLMVTLPGGLVFYGQDKSTSTGFYLDEGEFAWFDGVDVRRDTTERPQAHGSFDTPGFLGSRTIPMKGICLASSTAELAHMGNQLKGVLAGGGSGRVQVVWNGETTWADVRLAAQTKFSPDPVNLVGDFQITFWAADPRKFGETRTFAAGVAAYHFGNFAASPVHTITGVAAGYTINGPGGKTFTVTEAVTSEVPHRIDMATGFLEVGGVVVVGKVTSADVWTVPGGGTVTHTLTGAGLTLSTAVTDTYI